MINLNTSPHLTTATRRIRSATAVGAAPVLFAALLLCAGAASAATYLDAIPGPDDTGGMVMPMVSLNFGSQSVSVSMGQSNTVALYPLQQYEVWGGFPYADAAFNPALAGEPWYDLLDPSRQHLPFSTRFGFELVSGNGHLIPVGSYVYIKATALTDGLKIYDVGYWTDVWEQQGEPAQWYQVFGEGNFGGTLAPQFDNVAAWGDSGSIKMWHPIALVPSEGLYSARFEIYLGDGDGQALEGWSSASITLNWNALAPVPEPALAALLAAAAMAGAVGLRRRKNDIDNNAAGLAG